MEELLKLEHLSVDYKVKNGYLSAVNDINLNVYKGEILALVGESGCGKSTVAYSILRLLDKNQQVRGKISFRGKDLMSLSQKEMEDIRGKKIGMIFQNPMDSLNPVYRSGYQVYEAIALDGIKNNEAWKKVKDLYKMVMIPDPSKNILRYPHELSGGMRQRVMIAMMLSRNPELLIADEPTTALDVTIEAQILEIIKGLKEKLNTSIIIITHNFGVVAEVADKIGVMYAGELVEYGDVMDIFASQSHPYTRALMLSLPRISKHERRLKTIEGSVPRIIGKFKGCRFSNRCPYVMNICREKTPELQEIEPNHYCRCYKELK